LTEVLGEKIPDPIAFSRVRIEESLPRNITDMKVFQMSSRMVQGVVGLSLALFGLSACGDSVTNPQDLVFAPELGVNLPQMTRSPVGLYHQDEVVGTGALAQFGHRVTVHYTGWLHTGQEFDTSTGGDGFVFGPLGQGNVIAGWNMGIQGMRVGGRRLLVIPPSLAYGGGGRGAAIPANATLVFRVELTEVTQWIQ